MRFQSRRSINGVLTGLVLVLITLLVLGIVTGKIIFYILMGVVILFVIISVVGVFTFLKKTGQETASTRKSTYDISKGKNYTDESHATKGEKAQEESFCEFCGMKLETGVKTCSNCGKKSK
ncbi:MAG: zinc ribbon domain-containing protein [Candidatus Heimdallarchaeota archaeon]|nr:zinc ribbon domain-containing protein [Candidatus Heimdallarchaeota archaeon]MCK4253326.1 zinc ribbon domain-containing protein [Candidatus Heimdallarchaeota archaeon]